MGNFRKPRKDNDKRKIIIGNCKLMIKEYISYKDIISYRQGPAGFNLGDGDDCCNCRYHIEGSCEWSSEKGFNEEKWKFMALICAVVMIGSPLCGS